MRRRKLAQSGVLCRSMAFFLDTQETAERFGKYIEEYQALFRERGVAFGTPEDFFRLTPKLAYDDEFRVAFSALTRSIGQREQGGLTLTRVLTIVAIALGGSGIDELGSGSAVSVSLVVVFLAGVGGWSEREIETAEMTEVSSRSTEEESVVRVREVTPIAVGVKAIDEQEALEFEQRVSQGSSDNFAGMTSSVPVEPALVKDALSRLEINTLELKHYLDSIDSRIDRIEPHLNGRSPRTNASEGNGTTQLRVTEKVKFTLPVQRYSYANTQTAIQVPPPVVQANASQLRRLRGLVIMLGALLVVAVAAAVYLYFEPAWRRSAETRGMDGKSLVSEKMATPEANGGGVAAAPSALSLGTAQGELPRARAPSGLRAGEEQPGRVANTEEQPIPVLSPGPRKIAPLKVDDSAPPSVTKGMGGVQMAGAVPGAVANARRPAVSVVTPPPAPPATPSAPPTTPSEAATEKSPALVPGPIFVPSSSLRDNVLASPKPAYPVGAHLQKLEGDVILQAVISVKGSVESVRVVSGPVALQQAAVDAMKLWKYRPYMVNGTPVPVRTFVSFHFTIERPTVR
jgi:TonB family protein